MYTQYDMMTMRLLIDIVAERDTKYMSDYYHKVQGIIWRSLKNSPLEELHSTSEIPKFCFSNPFPTKNYSEGERAKILVSSPHQRVITEVNDNLENSDFNIGEMPFTVDNITTLNPDVGDINSKGVLQSSVGVYIPVDEDDRNSYDINGYKESDKISWSPRNHPYEVFRDKFVENLNWKLDALKTSVDDKPTDLSEIFEEVDIGDTHAVKIPIGQDPDDEFTFLLTQIRGEYVVQSNEHRVWLNTLLECGMGWRNPLGFGFTNIRNPE